MSRVQSPLNFEMISLIVSNRTKLKGFADIYEVSKTAILLRMNF